MKEIRNLTRKPLRVPLPQGKTLHLNPNQEGQVPTNAVDHPPFQKMVEDGEIEVLGEGHVDKPHPTKEEKAHGTRGPGQARNLGGLPPSGDR